jgi:hypothetical protein
MAGLKIGMARYNLSVLLPRLGLARIPARD